MRNGWRVVADLGLGALRIRGADAVSFLQGQLSNDASRIRSGALQLSGYHSPQGRAIALLRLTAIAPDDLLAVLPLELIPLVTARLTRFVLRAKVQILDESAQWDILGFQGAPPGLSDGALAIPYGSSRQLVLIPKLAGIVIGEAGATSGARRDWIACDIAEGLPQVYLPTSEAFVAQMLNLDLTGGIALDKGCYTGQEIIARAHYRGQVKRRMQRFASAIPCTLAPGQTGTLADGRTFKVVESVPLQDGFCEFLAVTNPAPMPDLDTDGAEQDDAAQTQTLAVITVRSLPLPYELPAVRA